MSDRAGMDQRVERVLRSFGGAEADGGLEGRVLSRLAAVRVEHAAETRMWRVRGAVACACLGMCVAAVWLVRERSMRPLAVPSKVSMASLVDAGLATEASSGPNRNVPTAGTTGLKRGYVTRVAAHVPREEQAAKSLEADEVAVSEMSAPTRIAPPQPLTEQERLLLRAAKRSGAYALAEGNADGDGALRVEQMKRQAETNTLFAAFGKGLFAGINAAADE
ncbi:MAG: hypothetical protein NVSMB62_26420 [Acidobacteriaceae bacterium]